MAQVEAHLSGPPACVRDIRSSAEAVVALRAVSASVACEDIKVSHMQAAVNAAPTAGEGDLVRRCVSALIGAGLAGGYLVNPRLVQVHWQPGERLMPEAISAIAGKHRLRPLPI